MGILALGPFLEIMNTHCEINKKTLKQYYQNKNLRILFKSIYLNIKNVFNILNEQFWYSELWRSEFSKKSLENYPHSPS